tara:strand:+ start:2750 stop:3331 length:582 start_codon:yes stop_codon:yes gene_type:complete
VRVIAGSLRGRPIKAPEVRTTRPTLDRVRESIFNVLETLLQRRGLVYEKLAFLDVFAGSGAMGIESLSRGGMTAGFIEQNHQAFITIKANLERFDLNENSWCYRRNALKPGDAHTRYDVIFLDPPYEKNIGPKALLRLDQELWLKKECLVILEISQKENLPSLEGFDLLERRSYGTVQVLFFARQPENDEIRP